MADDARATAYPLCWPEGWPRTASYAQKSSNLFNSGGSPVSFDRARRKLFAALSTMKASFVTLSTNYPLRGSGEPTLDADRRRIDDTGVALYFTWKGKQYAMAQDRFDRLAGNVRSLGLAIEAMRQLERHGGGAMMSRAFAGFAALPPPEGEKPRRPWWEVLRYSADPAERELLSVGEVTARHKTLAKKCHPDTGGSTEAMSELNVALEDAKADLGVVTAEE